VKGDAVDELRLVVTVDDVAAALALFRDALGLREITEFAGPGRVVLLDAGRATVELTDPTHAAHIDEVEVGRRVAGPIRVAFRVADLDTTTERVVATGASLIAPPTATPWGSRNTRLEIPGVLQLTLFEESAHDRDVPDGP
jgi:lactoylglutathione lyase